MEQSGQYRITANNGVGGPVHYDFEVEVEPREAAPEFLEVPRDRTLEAGDDHVVRAVVSGYPTPNMYMVDEEGELVPRGLVEQEGPNIVAFSVIMPNVQVSIYRVNAW